MYLCSIWLIYRYISANSSSEIPNFGKFLGCVAIHSNTVDEIALSSALTCNNRSNGDTCNVDGTKPEIRFNSNLGNIRVIIYGYNSGSTSTSCGITVHHGSTTENHNSGNYTDGFRKVTAELNVSDTDYLELIRLGTGSSQTVFIFYDV